MEYNDKMEWNLCCNGSVKIGLKASAIKPVLKLALYQNDLNDSQHSSQSKTAALCRRCWTFSITSQQLVVWLLPAVISLILLLVKLNWCVNAKDRLEDSIP